MLLQVHCILNKNEFIGRQLACHLITPLRLDCTFCEKSALSLPVLRALTGPQLTLTTADRMRLALMPLTPASVVNIVLDARPPSKPSSRRISCLVYATSGCSKCVSVFFQKAGFKGRRRHVSIEHFVLSRRERRRAATL